MNELNLLKVGTKVRIIDDPRPNKPHLNKEGKIIGLNRDGSIWVAWDFLGRETLEARIFQPSCVEVLERKD